MAAKGKAQGSAEQPAPEGFMSVRDAMARLSVSETTIYRLIEKKRLTRFKVLGCTRLSRAEIEKVAKPS